MTEGNVGGREASLIIEPSDALAPGNDIRENQVEEAVRYLDGLLTHQRAMLLEASRQGDLSEQDMITAAFAIQKIAGDVAEALEDIRLDLFLKSKDLSPESLNPENLSIRLDSFQYSHDGLSQMRIIEKLRKSHARVLADFVLLYSDRLLWVDKDKIKTLVSPKYVKFVEYNLRKYLPIGQKVSVEEAELVHKARTKV